MQIARALLTIAVLSAVLCLVLWRHLGLPICVGIVSSSSMDPTIPLGSIVIGIRDEPRIGSIVVLDINGRLVMHRVVYMNSTHVVTKGDACLENDPPTPLKNILCVVVYHIRGEAIALSTIVAITGWYLAKNLRKKIEKRKKLYTRYT
ncbi:MAG: S24/S26 family peptidase [Ignisphaera sp.]